MNSETMRSSVIHENPQFVGKRDDPNRHVVTEQFCQMLFGVSRMELIEFTADGVTSNIYCRDVLKNRQRKKDSSQFFTSLPVTQ
uniref:Uncharacterized protein n=2 Tax=Caenorhabditis japonica TaxID=281687 RepID=A0A8R1EAK1_CAEJA